MLSIDLKNAFQFNGDNFTVLLLRLIAKADGSNRMKLRMGFPVQVKAVELYQNDCPYTEEIADGCRQVDWNKLAERAEKES